MNRCSNGINKYVEILSIYEHKSSNITYILDKEMSDQHSEIHLGYRKKAIQYEIKK